MLSQEEIKEGISTKTLDDYFADWESSIFGFGYGSGEEYTIPALKRFMELCIPNDSGNNPSCYDFQILEKELTPTVAWLLINILCHDDIIEYGTSPRFGWLTDRGNLLKDYIQNHTIDQLYEVTMRDERYFHCSPDYCNCDDKKYEKDKCKNPFYV